MAFAVRFPTYNSRCFFVARPWAGSSSDDAMDDSTNEGGAKKRRADGSEQAWRLHGAQGQERERAPERAKFADYLTISVTPSEANIANFDRPNYR